MAQRVHLLVMNIIIKRNYTFESNHMHNCHHKAFYKSLITVIFIESVGNLPSVLIWNDVYDIMGPVRVLNQKVSLKIGIFY